MGNWLVNPQPRGLVVSLHPGQRGGGEEIGWEGHVKKESKGGGFYSLPPHTHTHIIPSLCLLPSGAEQKHPKQIKTTNDDEELLWA